MAGGHKIHKTSLHTLQNEQEIALIGHDKAEFDAMLTWHFKSQFFPPSDTGSFIRYALSKVQEKSPVYPKTFHKFIMEKLEVGRQTNWWLSL